MSDSFTFDDEFYPVPASAVDADPAASMRELLYRVSRLEQGLEEEKVQALSDTKEFLLELLALSDDIAAIVDRWGVTTKANEAAIIRSVVALGRKVRKVLDHHGVSTVSVVGQPYDPKTSQSVESEERLGVADGTVLRELRVGYVWPYGVLRQAQVVVNRLPEVAETAAPLDVEDAGETADTRQETAASEQARDEDAPGPIEEAGR